MKKQIYYLMRLLPFFLIVLVVSSCQKYKKEIESLSASKDSIQGVVNERETKIVEYIGSFNEIQNNLDSIKRLQKIMDVNLSNPNGEVTQTDKDKIIEDINLINNLLNENKKMVESLRSKLKKSNLRITELEQMIVSYQRLVEEKDAEISVLRSEIEKMQIDIQQLNEQVTTLADEGQRKSETIEKQKDEMHTAYYCFGTKEELIANNVVEKIGGVIGMGKTLRIKKDFNKDYFMKVDTRKFSEVVLAAKKAEFVSTHPEGSFHFVGDEKTIESLVIDQSDEFWKASRFMVIVIETKK